jgi:hypothetical protein
MGGGKSMNFKKAKVITEEIVKIKALGLYDKQYSDCACSDLAKRDWVGQADCACEAIQDCACEVYTDCACA